MVWFYDLGAGRGKNLSWKNSQPGQNKPSLHLRGLITKLQVVAEIKRLCFPPQHQDLPQDDHPPGCPCRQTYEEPVLGLPRSGTSPCAFVHELSPLTPYAALWGWPQPSCAFAREFPISGFSLLKANSNGLLWQAES